MRARSVAVFALSIVGLLSLTTPLAAQGGYVTFTPNGGTYNPSTQVSGTIEYCSTSGPFDAWNWSLLTLNGADVGGSFSFQHGSQSGCDDYGVATGTLNGGSGAN